jgi:ABC-2 type transport system ATP-binding protein
MIEVEHLAKHYGETIVLQDVDFRALPGQITILTGDNGAGKTTLLRILAGLTDLTAGTAKLSACSISSHRRTAQAHLSFLPQNLAFHPAMTPKALIHFYARIRGLDTHRELTGRVLDRFDLTAEETKQVQHLSGGTLQRLGLALLLLPDAPILLLDEPAISLDPAWRKRLSELLCSQAAAGKTVFLTTHLPDEWEGEAHQHLRCEGGRILPADRPALPQPADSPPNNRTCAS